MGGGSGTSLPCRATPSLSSSSSSLIPPLSPPSQMEVKNGFPSPLQWFIRFNKSRPVNSGFFSPAALNNWYWPTAGFYANGKLFLLNYLVYSTSGGPGDDLSFLFNGTTVITISNPEDDPNKVATVLCIRHTHYCSQWKYTEEFLPQTNGNLTLCTAAYVEDGYVYLLG